MKAEGSAKLVVACALLVGVFAIVRPAIAPLAASAASKPDGAAIYSAKCASCHKADGKGGAPFPALAGSTDVTAKDPTAIIVVTVKGKGMMPGFRTGLSNADIRTSWGNKASAVTEAQVAAVH
jgi:mono/diheme cytochrome c family protein